jgi:hypothetical protein
MTHFELIQSLWNYRDNRIRPGSFVHAVLHNDLAGAIMLGDSGSLDHLREVLDFVRYDLPSEAWGSREKVQAWLNPKNLFPSITDYMLLVTIKDCPDCRTPLPPRIAYRENLFGWPVKDYEVRYWLSIYCENGDCQQEWALNTLGVSRPGYETEDGEQRADSWWEPA